MPDATKPTPSQPNAGGDWHDTNPHPAYAGGPPPKATYRLGWVSVVVTLAVVAIAAGLTFLTWQAYMAAPWTRDGSVRVYVVSLAPEVTGKVDELHVTDNQFVHKGDLLMMIDPRDYQIAVKLAEAAVAQAAADMKNKQTEANRRAQLNDLATTAEEQQTYKSNADSATAVYQQMQANLDKARLNLRRTEIHSPVNGWVTNLATQLGDFATAGTRALSLVNADSFWVDGYFEETKLGAIHDGDPAKVWLLGYRAMLPGHVDSVARGIVVGNAAAGTSGLADVNPIFTWVRLAQRIPVRVHLDTVPADVRLVAGMTATVEVDPAGATAAKP